MIVLAPSTLGPQFAVKAALLVVLAASAIWAVRNARRVIGVFKRYFDEEGSPIDLAVFRIVLFATILLAADPALIDRFCRLPQELVTPPLGFGFVLHLLPIEPTLASWATLVLRAACLFALIGLFTRSAALVAGLVAVYVLGIPQCFGQVDHYHFLVWFALLLAVSRCGDALSIDAAVRRYRGGEGAPPTSVIYARPIRWVWLLIGVIYFFPGLWKLWISGSDWLFGDALISHLRRKWVELRWVPAIRPDNYKTLMRAAGLGSITFELSFLPLVLFRRTRPLVALAGLAFHNLSTLLLGISFIWLQAMYVSFLQVGRFVPRLLHRRESGTNEGPHWARGQMRALDLAGGLFLSASLVMGGLLIERGWPFACFPTFARFARKTSTELEFVAIAGSDKATPIDAWPLIQGLGTERWGPMARQGSRVVGFPVCSRPVGGVPRPGSQRRCSHRGVSGDLEYQPGSPIGRTHPARPPGGGPSLTKAVI